MRVETSTRRDWKVGRVSSGPAPTANARTYGNARASSSAGLPDRRDGNNHVLLAVGHVGHRHVRDVGRDRHLGDDGPRRLVVRSEPRNLLAVHGVERPRSPAHNSVFVTMMPSVRAARSSESSRL